MSGHSGAWHRVLLSQQKATPDAWRRVQLDPDRGEVGADLVETTRQRLWTLGPTAQPAVDPGRYGQRIKLLQEFSCLLLTMETMTMTTKIIDIYNDLF